MIIKERLYWNADRNKLVREGPEAAFLAYGEGSEIAPSEAHKLGIVDGRLADPELEKVELRKASPRPADKAAAKPADK